MLFIACLHSASAQYKLYETGVNQYNTGRFQEAVTSLSTYLERKARDKKLDVEAYYVRALALYKNREFDRAIADFNQALNLGRKNSGNLYWLIGKCHGFMNQNGEAIRSYTKAHSLITDSKKQAQLLFERANLYTKAGEKDLAEADLKRTLLLNPEHYLAQEALAELVSSTKHALTQKTSDTLRTKRIALIIGNGKYPETIGQLRNSVNDAIAVASELRKLDFETLVKINLPAGEIRKSIREFHALLRDSDPAHTVALFYYAGHGLQVEGTNYIIPVDALIHDVGEIEKLCVSVDAAMDAMQYADVKMSIMILDACRNNPFPRTSQTLKSGLAPPNPTTGAFIGYATAPGSVASDGVADNGLYTQELIKVLRIQGLSIEQVFKKVRENVLTLSNGQQHTWDTSNLIADFYFNQ